ncbi:impt-1 [Pristionchus pacificus]|uniref:Impt-1 n=1 Tax=Pristionchus pacificus TaxID=54126 RepID=A0A2A6B4J9_PRIPA|nr:impt-1 [Pristionchus pacificus]|eukprot:PDM60783.1 impt-1 [Pristionchus pacificus]
MSDAQAQAEELEVIEAIYPNYFNLMEVNKVSLRFDDKIRLDVVLPPDYPSQSPPKYTLSCPQLLIGQRNRLSALLDESYLENIGSPILYAWIMVITEFLQELEQDPAAESSFDTSPDSLDDTSFSSIPDEVAVERPSTTDRPRILTGEIFSDRKSTFQAHIARVNSREEVQRVLSVLKSNNKIARATHNIYAYRVRAEKDGQNFQMDDCFDDGEHGASPKMMQILQTMKANGLIVVVSRWYGGIHLGPDRFRIINNLTREIVTQNPDCWFAD